MDQNFIQKLDQKQTRQQQQQPSRNRNNYWNIDLLQVRFDYHQHY